MEHYITLFDSLFLPQGLALHDSMERHAGKYRLWVLCMDEKAYEVLIKLDLPNLRPLRLNDVETPELLSVKQGRSNMEYCWTLTPFTTKFVFDRDKSAKRATYIDADMWFRKSPAPIFRELELSDKKVLITDHNYDARFDQSHESGLFCVQFMTFYRDGGEEVRQWWQERCVEWCFARFEDGKFGDQRYLDDWPERFPEQVHVLQQKEWFLAPWNAYRFPYGNCIVYHFQGLRLLKNGKVLPGGKSLPHVLLRYVYEPYLEVLRKKVLQLRDIGFNPPAQKKHSILLRFFKRRFDTLEELWWWSRFRHGKRW